MTYLVSDAATFTDQMIDGFVAAHADLVRRVEGGVVRTSATPPGQVAVVIGGGSGHYPAFAGYVGAGLGHGAAMGNVFASPSAQQVYAVARAVAGDSGVLLSYGNYAGDVLNFDQAQERLRAEGIDCRTVAVTDDISSAPATERHRRRGVAGDFVVFRAAGWASEQGRSLAQVQALADRANSRTRSLGVAFSGCTLPGADSALFTVPAGRMAVGMGVHGEPGIEELDRPTAEELAELLVARLLAEGPDDGCGASDRVGLIVNGLGSVKSEELFVVYQAVAPKLRAAGLRIVAPEVGELATSFEMAGVSLTLCWLDEELERAWTGPATAPAYRRGAAPAAASDEPPTPETPVAGEPAAVVTGPDGPPQDSEQRSSSQPDRDAQCVLAALRAISAVLDREVDELGRLDAVAGDGDHGIGMQRGARAALSAAESAVAAGSDAGTTLGRAAAAWADRAGGTSGALWGVGLQAVADRLDTGSGPYADRLAEGVADAAEAVARAGKAERGDKTMLDALFPFSLQLTEQLAAGAGQAQAWQAAAGYASTCAADTADLQPKIGRARTHSQKSVGTPDPGAVSLALAVTAVAEVLAGEVAS